MQLGNIPGGELRADPRTHGEKLLALTDRLCEPLPFDEVAHVIVDEAVRAAGADTGALWTVDESGTHATLVRSVGYEAAFAASIQRIPVEPWLPMGDALLRREALFLESRADYGARYPKPEQASRSEPSFEELSYACLPLVVNGRSIAGVTIVYLRKRPFDAEERTFLTVFARHAAQALERARLFEREAVVRRRLERLQRLTSELSSAASVREVAHLATHAATEALGLSTSALWMVDEAGDLHGIEQLGLTPDRAEAFRFVPRDADLAVARVARTGKTEWGEAYGGGMSYVSVPLVRDGAMLGVIGFGAHGRQTFAPDEEAFVIAVADACADALARARLYDQAQAASRAKDEFLAMLGHELRNPLSPIVTALHLLRRRNGGTPDREHMVLERQVSHLVRLVDDLLDVSRIARGTLRLERSPIELGPVVAAAIEMASPLVEERRHTLSVSVPGSGLVVDGDSQRLTQVISNVLTNAAKYTPPGGHIAVSARCDGGQAVVEVTDDGTGIPADLLPRIFEAFTQGQRWIDRREGGLGLGLAIARQLVARHDGTIHATSLGEGRGTTVTVRLPLSTTSTTAATKRADEASRIAAPGRPRRVLVVDDNTDAAVVLEMALRAAGHDVRTAPDGPSALDLLAEFTPDIAFLDIGLPVMDGYELAGRLQQVPALSHTRLVAITGYAQPQDRERALARGFAEHLPKPLDPDHVLSCIERLLAPTLAPTP